MDPRELMPTAARAAAVYVLMLIVIRALGKRTVGNCSAFDLLVALMLGEVVDEIVYGDVLFLQGAIAIVAIAGLAYADSWLAYAVAEEEAFPQTAERLLTERGHPDIEVINGGIPDYNTRQERQLLERLMPVYEPDAVFLAYLVNDAEPSTAMPTPPEESYRHAHSWFLAELAEVANRRVFRRSVFRSQKDTVAGNYLDGFAEDSPKWRDSRQAIQQMRDMCAAARIPFAVLIPARLHPGLRRPVCLAADS